ncbi:2-oxo acid dehydrogenase subunit E2 [Ruegeria pomeroyi]|nr:2-oxo acid dehydrogenase subunit E2 [Ruegeria pomeroyi]
MGVFRMPSLGADMEAGTLVEWLVNPGDTVARGDVVAVVETQKGAIEIEVFEAGTVTELLAEIGQTLPVGAPMARIGDGEETGAEPKPPEEETRPAPKERSAPALPAEAEAPSEKPAQPRQEPPASAAGASPAARRAAQEAGIDLVQLKGSGPQGAIVLADVEAQMGQATRTSRPAGEGLSDMRQAVAAAMSRSKREIPHFYVSHTVETQPVSDWLAQQNAERPPADRILLGAVFVKAAAMAARQVAALNGHFTGGGFVPSETVNIGMVISLRGGGLVAPALADVDKMSLSDVMAGLRDMVTRARSGRLRGSEFTRGTLTVSSLGEDGAEGMTGVIFPPQVALLAVGAPQIRPWVTGAGVEPRQVTTLVLSADHRVCDGRQASRFLVAIQDCLARPEEL